MKEKPTRFVVKPTLEALVELVRRLTGREPTPEEIEHARRRLDALKEDQPEGNIEGPRERGRGGPSRS